MILVGDVTERLRELPDGSVHLCVTSPPYWGLRRYLPAGHPDEAKQLGLEPTLDCRGACGVCYLCRLVGVFDEVRRVLRDDGSCFVNIGDSYASGGGWRNNEEDNDRNHKSYRNGAPTPDGLKPKDLCLVPERFALRMQEAGWWVRSRIAWCKRSAMPESVTDRPTSAWEHLWMFAKSARYFYDAEAVKTPASDSFATDPRHLTGSNENNAKDGYEEAGAQNPKGPHRMFSRSGNKERVYGVNAASPHRAQGVPWEGATANLRNWWALSVKKMRLRPDLTPQQRSYVLERLAGTDRGGRV